MENKVTMPALVAMLALTTGQQKKLCEDFLKELFAIIEEELTSGGNVRIKGFGTFKLVEVEARKSVNVSTGEDSVIPGHTKVMFVASKELASRVNLPFEIFEAVEISDDLPTDTLDGGEDADLDDDGSAPVIDNNGSAPVIDNNGSAPVIDNGSAPVIDNGSAPVIDNNGSAPVIDNGSAPVIDNGSAPVKDDSKDNVDMPQKIIFTDIEEDVVAFPIEPIEKVDEIPTDETVEQEENTYEEILSEEDSDKRSVFLKGFFTGLAVAVVLGVIGFSVWYFFMSGSDERKPVPVAVVEKTSVGKVEADSVAASVADSVRLDSTALSTAETVKSVSDNDVPTKASDEPVYDTVTTTRYLTTIAKEHYGNFNLWPIIYEENSSFLGHPDRISPGTKVVVPPLSKYGIDPKNPDHVQSVKRKGAAIYARFKKAAGGRK
ncbi:HU family DNA-binding protein [Muribaculaceae bacterium Isolate-037 (Harlan)]|jgi:nucleoid DNA-binding protein|nr:HU family DNA-binding protein [Muribaculaceae bacterium Isolate-037 (Harlan)]